MKQRLLFAMMMAFITTLIVSFLLVAVNRGFAAGFVPVWLKSWVLAYITALPVVIFVSPKVQSLSARLTAK